MEPLLPMTTTTTALLFDDGRDAEELGVLAISTRERRCDGTARGAKYFILTLISFFLSVSRSLSFFSLSLNPFARRVNGICRWVQLQGVEEIGLLVGF